MDQNEAARNNTLLALQAGLELTSDESDVQVPTRLVEGVFYLRHLLQQLADGRLIIGPAVQTGKDAEKAPEPEEDGD
jgi:hypothetical protein